ncbi:G2/mitotic-specific cyclin S13-7-like [Mercurialis annua]|uniref:G2/mitotic-specific cyclin S13-7-like n=1 Tax=Mercurialis annua TaxID=3986 RepID=UPI00215EA1FA|nr:G2/mitotic-specific cyclin S13-7-like [Mercurialis annua]
MASRHMVPQQQQPRGEAIVGGNKNMQQQQKKNGAGNRRPLGDIGNNLATLKAINEKAANHRPMTRSFCAQLLANAQNAAAAENNKKLVCVNVDKKPKAAQQQQKKAVVEVKQKPEEVIEISPETEKPQVVEKKKVQQTFTSALTARSKLACGITKKPKDEIVDIDAADANNELAGVEYVEDIYSFYKEVENEGRPHNYMESQPEINDKMRAILIDWLIDVHQKFELSRETLYLTINIIDRFLSVKTVPRRELQLVGISATLVASKYEEIWPPEVNDLVCISDRAYSHQQVLSMEKTILGKLEWILTVPTHYVFLARFIKASIPDKQMENMVYYLAELGIMHYDAVMYCPSMVAASAVYAARCSLKKSPVWTETLKLHTGYSESQVKNCGVLLAFLHSKAAENKLQTVYRKYSHPERDSVSMIPPSKCLLPPSLSS